MTIMPGAAVPGRADNSVRLSNTRAVPGGGGAGMGPGSDISISHPLGMARIISLSGTRRRTSSSRCRSGGAALSSLPQVQPCSTMMIINKTAATREEAMR